MDVFLIISSRDIRMVAFNDEWMQSNPKAPEK